MKELFKNCLRVEERDGWLVPLRFTEHQMQVYTSNEARLIRSNAPSSVILSFKSAAKKISFRYRITGKARDWASVDVVCDGVLKESINLVDDSGFLEIELSGDVNVGTHIYLPHLVCFELRDITSDATLIPTENKRKSWLALGDSITQGMVAKRASGAYPSLISERFDLGVINAGVGGIRFEVTELDYIGFEPDIITVALGCNDWGIPKKQLELNVSNYIERLISIYKCRNIHLILPTWRSDFEEQNAEMTFAEHREVIREVAARYSFINIIDGYNLVPHLEDYFGDPSDLNVHPNDEGFLRYAFALTKHVNFNG